jgi:hypothetical protein
MKSHLAVVALIACASVFTGSAPLSADTQSWPWKDTAPVDPALAMLAMVDTLTVSVGGSEPPTLSVSVEAQAPTPGFTELTLTPRLGDPNDLIFAFDARGRRPQEMTIQVLTPVTISAEYTDAPLQSVGVIEVYAQGNCKAFSLKDKTEVDCTMNPGSQQAQ